MKLETLLHANGLSLLKLIIRTSPDTETLVYMVWLNPTQFTFLILLVQEFDDNKLTEYFFKDQVEAKQF